MATVAIATVLVGGCGSTSQPPPSPGSGQRDNAPALGPLAASGAGHRFYEIYDPPGRPRGTMLMIHGGGWFDGRGDARKDLASASLIFRSQGWRVVNISYSSGPSAGAVAMMRDVVAFYDQIRRAFGGPICAYGESAGGHLAAMLAIERPSLTCAILNAAPLDLPTLSRHTVPQLLPDLTRTFGTKRSVLAQWSPALRWDPRVDHTAVFATAAADDKVVPPQQLYRFQAADRSANGTVVKGGVLGSPNAMVWLHSLVDRQAMERRVVSLVRWLDRIVPRRASGAAAPAADSGTDCDARPAGAERWRLLLAGDAWKQTATPGQPLVSTRGCSGSGARQDDGLSLWAFPGQGAAAAAGAETSLELSSGHVLHQLSVSMRGFLARPRDWVLGLYASSATSGPIQTPVALCDRGRCQHLGLLTGPIGALITAPGSRGNPDRSNDPPTVRFVLPHGTRRLAWRLRCVAASGCSLAPVDALAGVSLRPRDPLGQPAILALYRVAVG